MSSLPEMMVCDQRSTADLLDPALLITALARAALEARDGLINSPARSVLPIGAGTGALLSMPAVASDIAIHKLVSVHSANPARGMAAVQGLVTVLDADTGNPICILDGPELTGRRTAAVSLLAICCFLLEPPRTVLLIGTGVQAAHHIKALNAIFPGCRLLVKGRTAESSLAFCKTIRGATCEPMPFDGHDHSVAQVVITLTNSLTPVFMDMPMAGQLIIAVGAYKQTMAEIGPETVAACQLFVDDLTGAKHEAGDLLQANIDWARVQTLSSALEQRPFKQDQPILFKSVGCAAWDLAAARVALSQLK